MADITLLYYTANTIEEQLGENVRKHLQSIRGDLPLISVSQKPLEFGFNVCVGEIGKNYYNCYKQILTGAELVQTRYVACCEDDTLYTKEHFSHRPTTDEVFSYNKNMWYCEETEFWTKGWTGMLSCIVSTKYLIDTLTPRFLKHPKEIHGFSRDFQEPGRNDGAKAEYWLSNTPIVTFNYFNALGGKAKSVAHPPTASQFLETWGDCWDLKKKYWGRARPREECIPKYGRQTV